MPGLSRKLTVSAGSDGLLVHASGIRGRRSENVQIAYDDNKISFVRRKEDDESLSSSVEAHGLVGLMNLGSTSHLILITRRGQVAQIRGKAIYAVRDVVLLPLTSQSEAEKAIGLAAKNLKLDQDAVSESSESEESDVEDEEAAPEVGLKKSSSFAKDVIQERGIYGRFASRWFSRGGMSANARRKQGMSSEEGSMDKDDPAKVESTSAAPDDAATESQGDDQDDKTVNSKPSPSKGKRAIESLTPRILRNARLYLSSSGFYFSYDHDLSGTLMQRSELVSDMPLWKRFDELYFWNRHLIEPFIKSGHDELALPLMQGFVGQRAFSIERTDDTQNDLVAEASQDPEDVISAQSTPSQAQVSDTGSHMHEFLLTLISRRSVRRAGLRYLRRGIDDDGNVANNVETEQILSPMTWKSSDKVFSLVQLRGSIPLHFSQSPYSFKPTPVTFGSNAVNHAAFKKHFDSVAARYGKVQVACLVDKHDPEVTIGQSFEDHAKQLNESGGSRGNQIGFEWFDFHSACKGMKFENVSILMDSLDQTLKSFGYIVKQKDRNIKLQSGVLRTNCMDCLDRTNVVQSSVAGWALQQQLSELGLNIDLKKDHKTQWFNTLWADNGDAISKQYAGTAALKGDFTRTRKRNWTGALSDFSLSLNRYYNNVFGDYFMQTCIDFYLGNADLGVFDEFETDMMSKDYAFDIRRIRKKAIDTCEKIVLENQTEEMIAGWTLSCPRECNTLRSLPFEECVVLLTTAALFFCRFDWNTEKIGSFERVDLLDIKELWRGAYITSALGSTHLDETTNVGFALRYNTSQRSIIRTNTRSLQTEEGEAKGNENESEKQDSPRKDESRLLAFKVLLPQSSGAHEDGSDIAEMNEMQLAKHICGEVQKALAEAMRRDQKDGLKANDIPQVQEKDVISVADAKKSTGYAESIGYSLKRLVWS